MGQIEERLKYARKSAGFTQQTLAEHLNVAAMTIKRYEKDARSITVQMLSDIAMICNVSVVWLLTGTGDISQIDTKSAHQATPAHEEIVRYFKDKELARLINANLIKLEQIKPEALKRISEYVKLEIRMEGGNPDEELEWQELARHLKNGTSGQ